ncbi:MAG: sigma 54-interacting transcriptional regulator [Thermodesulfobacteriota bacterium]|nr:sigma 54-interacting transcriptional regulator [Thermodesulfobacteriota bacterium]
MNKGAILFLCRDNTARSQMAEGFARQMAGDDVAVFSAGITPGPEVHPMAVEVMAEHGIDISGHRPKAVSALRAGHFDLAVDLCQTLGREFPMLAGFPPLVCWTVADPAEAVGDLESQRAAFREAARIIKDMVHDLLNRGYYASFSLYKANIERLIDNLHEGVLAHDLDRKIFFFSKGAERITGLSAVDVIGKNCHDVFVPRLCGDNCSFCDGCEPPTFQKKSYSTVAPAIEGQRKELDVTVVPLRDPAGRIQGVVAALADQTAFKEAVRGQKGEDGFAGIIGRTPEMRGLFHQIRDLSAYDVPVNISGETGTGKELVARAIHSESTRRNGPFVPINCGALPEGLVESELFGHVRGSFSGAVRDKKGRFELAHNGTIFLDEVAELPMSIQVKLLRFLQEGVLEKVGSEKQTSVDVRVISATNKNLKKEVAKGTFREDLYYRLNVVPIHLPPLRMRKNDIPLLATYFVRHAAMGARTGDITIADDAMGLLVEYAWPGNVRELQNIIQFLVIKASGNKITAAHLPPEIQGDGTPLPQKRGRRNKLDTGGVETALAKAGGNKAKAARLLGVGRATLYRFLNDHPGIVADEEI